MNETLIELAKANFKTLCYNNLGNFIELAKANFKTLCYNNLGNFIEHLHIKV